MEEKEINNNNVWKEVLLMKLAKTDIKLPISQKEFDSNKTTWDNLFLRRLVSRYTYEDSMESLRSRVLDNDTLRQFKKAVMEIEEAQEVPVFRNK